MTVEIALPADFRPADMLAFHRRDPSGLAERVEDDTLHKGMVWRGAPACLTIRFAPGRAVVEMAGDGPARERGLEILARRMLGLTQPVEVFEDLYRSHAQVGRLVAANPGLRLPVAATPFEALSWAITGQQISVGAAVSLRRRLIAAAGPRHAGGLACYPDAAILAGMGEEDLRGCGFSQTKARTLLALSRGVAGGRIPLESWLEDMAVERAAEGLLQVPGIGPWTVGYALLRGFGWLDGSLHGDVAVRRNLRVLLGREDKVGEAEARAWLEPFSPWRALVAAHLWAYKAAKEY